MIPQSFKDLISNGENVGSDQTLAMIIFLLLFRGIIWYVFTRPKKYYNEQENAPLGDDEEDTQLNN